MLAQKDGQAIKWAVIASGGIARRRTIPEGIMPATNADLVAVYDVDDDVNAEVAGQFNADAAGSVGELLESNIDAVYIASPANLHHSHVLECAKAGKHVLCEKPLGMTVEQAEEMARFCEKEKVKLGAAFMMRFHCQHQAALKMVQEGKLGKLVYGRAQLSCWYPPIPGAWRQDLAAGGGGSLIDLGGHCIDLLEMYFGKLRRVSCFVNNSVHDYQSEDSAVAMLHFENGAMATVDTFFCIPDESSRNILEIYGSRGSILANGTIGQSGLGEMTAILQSDGAGYNAGQAREETRGIPINPKPVSTYRAEIEEFSAALLEERESANGAELGLQSQKVITACYESACKGTVVNIA
jgi:predicted dehydrogenase